MKATQHDLRHELTDLRHEVAVLRDQLSHEASPEKGGGDAESSPSSSVTVKEGKTSAAEVHARVQVRGGGWLKNGGGKKLLVIVV